MKWMVTLLLAAVRLAGPAGEDGTLGGDLGNGRTPGSSATPSHTPGESDRRASRIRQCAWWREPASADKECGSRWRMPSAALR